MGAEHIVNPYEGTDQMRLENCWVTITADSAGIPIVRVSTPPKAAVLIYYNEEIIQDVTPDRRTRMAWEAERKAQADAKSDVEKVQAAVKARVEGGDATDPFTLAMEEALKLAKVAEAVPVDPKPVDPKPVDPVDPKPIDPPKETTSDQVESIPEGPA